MAGKKLLRSYSLMAKGLEGVESPTSEELSEIKPLVSDKLKITFQNQDIYYNLNPKPAESARILKRNPESTDLKQISQKYGFISPAVMIIENYVNFYMARYDEDHDEYGVREGLKAEKAFDLILQNMGLYVNYPEPVRDWRKGNGAPVPQQCDFYIPLLGKFEIKSVRPQYKGSNRVNVPRERWLEEKPDYLVALSHVGGRHVMLCGAMPAWKVSEYINSEYDIKYGDPPFLSIPLKHFPISARELYLALMDVKHKIDGLQKMQLHPE